jgi:hypothetical protein
MLPTSKEVLAYIQNDMAMPGIMVESTGGKPGHKALAAIERALESFDARKHTTAHNAALALEYFEGDEENATVPRVADMAIALSADDFATNLCMADGWDGNVTDGASFVVVN